MILISMAGFFKGGWVEAIRPLPPPLQISRRFPLCVVRQFLKMSPNDVSVFCPPHLSFRWRWCRCHPCVVSARKHGAHVRVLPIETHNNM